MGKALIIPVGYQDGYDDPVKDRHMRVAILDHTSVDG
jgi:hypothetical protein